MRLSFWILLLLLVVGLLFGCGRSPDTVGDAEPVSEPEVTSASADESQTGPSSAATEEIPAEPPSSENPEQQATPREELASQTIGPAGGTITVENPESPLHGLSLSVPENAYPEPTQFGISSRPFDGELPKNTALLTPVIEVENGGAYAEDLMTISIPVELPEDHFAMGFFLHEDGSLEGMPLVDLTSSSITVATMHFSDFLIAMIPNALLEVSVDTGFRPGKDDWRLPNYGSAIAPGGHCAGMSISAMWYYLERHKKGAPSLFGLYDNNGADKTPTIWEDDSLAYRLASTIQRDVNWSDKLRKSFNALAKLSGALTWRSFLFSMHATGEPQYVSVYSTEREAGHALIAYAADVEKGELYIADPNYRGEPRLIPYADGKLLPYISAKNLTDLLKGRFRTYDVIRYNAKSALVPWPQVASRWGELEAGTIGRDRFPGYAVYVKTEAASVPLHDGTETTQESIVLDVPEVANGIGVSVRQGETWLEDVEDGDRILLAPGDNLLGLLIHNDGIDEDGDAYENEYVNYHWVRVHRKTESVRVKIEVQVHASIERVNQPDSSVGYEGQTLTHDTPFEKLVIESPVDVQVTGAMYAAKWRGIPNEEQEGQRRGHIYLLLYPDPPTARFEAVEFLELEDGSRLETQSYCQDVPLAPSDDGTLLYLLTGKDVCKSVDNFFHDWYFSTKNTRKVTGFTCDEHSVIRVTIW